MRLHWRLWSASDVEPEKDRPASASQHRQMTCHHVWSSGQPMPISIKRHSHGISRKWIPVHASHGKCLFRPSKRSVLNPPLGSENLRRLAFDELNQPLAVMTRRDPSCTGALEALCAPDQGIRIIAAFSFACRLPTQVLNGCLPWLLTWCFRNQLVRHRDPQFLGVGSDAGRNPILRKLSNRPLFPPTRYPRETGTSC